MFRFSTRRTFLRAAAVGSALLPDGVLAQRAFVGGLPAEFDPAICTVGVAVALEKGYFARHNLDVELVNFGGSTDQLLEAIATGKADACVGMALRWLKPLEGGFDVKIAAGIHGGYMRLFGRTEHRRRVLTGARFPAHSLP